MTATFSGTNTPTAGGAGYGDGTTLAFTAAGTAGQVLTSAGASAPTWSVPGISAVTAITSSATLTSSSSGYQQTQMTAIGQAVTMPDATTMTVGSPRFYIDNSKGGYPVGVRDSTGVLLMGIAAGGTAFVSLESASTAAGVWSITGTNLEPGLITIDTTFSSTYLFDTSGHILAPYVALDSDKSIHFLTLSSGFAAVAVDNATKAVGTPVTVSATASMVPRSVFKITSTTAIVFYSSTANTLIAVVLSLSGATTISVGTPSSTLSDTRVGIDNFQGAPRIAQLDTTLYLLSWATADGAGNTSVAAFQVSSGTTVTLGSTVNIIAANNRQDSTTTYGLTATTGFVTYKSGAAAPLTNNGVVVSVTNANPPVCTVNTPASLTGVAGSISTAPPTCKLSATKILLSDNNNISGSIIASVFTIAGVGTTAGTAVSVETSSNDTYYTTSSATRYTPHLFPLTATTALMWYYNSSVSRTIILSESAGTVTKGTMLWGGVSNAISSNQSGGFIMAQGTTEFLASVNVSTTAPYTKRIAPFKISGTTITGGAATVSALVPGDGNLDISARLTSGDYILAPLTAWAANICVFRSNGDFVNSRGAIATPFSGNTSINWDFPIPTVSSNRIILKGISQATTTDAAGTYQGRLISVEIAA